MCEPLLLALEENLRLHDIDAVIFAPFVIERLQGGEQAQYADLQVLLRDRGDREERTIPVRLRWNPESAVTKPIAVQDRVVTEWAALGVACALLPSLIGMKVLSVAFESERFDYRIGDGTTEWGLEVSGTLTEDESELRGRLRMKRAQLRENPFRLSGYVVVVGFVRQETLLVFEVAPTGEIE